MELKWTSSSWTPDSDCPKGFKKKFLSSLSFPGEKYIGVDPTLDKKGILVDKVSMIFDKLLEQKKSLNFAQFMAVIVKDEELVTNINISKLLGRMEDRLADMMDMIMDQRVDVSLAVETAKSRSSIAKQILAGNPSIKDEL